MQTFLFRSLLLASAGATFSTHAASPDAAIDLPETVVTATRTETHSNELATATTVFTRADIEQLQVRTLPDLLKTAPGLDVVEQGGYGKLTSIFMRGTNSDHVLVLIDGIKVGSVTAGSTAFQLVPIEQIERVEIVRGPQSGLYGSEAIGGVIQIFTRKGTQGDKPSINLSAGAGSYDTINGSGAISGKAGNAWYSLGASRINSQGINALNGVEPDRDAYYNTGLNAQLGYRFDNGADVSASFLRSEGTTEFDRQTAAIFPTTVNKSAFVTQVISLNGNINFTDNWRSSLLFGQSRDDSDSFQPNGAFSSRFNTTRWNASWLNQLQLAKDHQLTLGTDYRFDEVDSSIRYDAPSRYDVGVFGQLHSRIFDNHFLNAAIRWDENEAVGDSVTGNIGWRYNWASGLSAFASFGNAFKAPTFNQLYYPNYGNANLKPEQSRSYEVGVSGTHSWANWEIRAYHTNVEDLIAIFPVENVDQARIEGIEASISGQTWGWQHKVSGNLIDPRDSRNGLRLQRRTQQSMSYDLSRSFADLDLGLHVLAEGNRFDDRANQRALAGFVTLDFRTAYHFDKNWSVSAKLNNVLDKSYTTAQNSSNFGFGPENFENFGRNFFFSIHYAQ